MHIIQQLSICGKANLSFSFEPMEISNWIHGRSVGCIFGELMRHKPLLPGNTEQKEIELIVNLLGSPNDTIWPGYSKLPFAKSLNLPQQE